MYPLLLILSDNFVVPDFPFDIGFSLAFGLVSTVSASFYFDVCSYCITYFIFSDLLFMVLAALN